MSKFPRSAYGYLVAEVTGTRMMSRITRNGLEEVGVGVRTRRQRSRVEVQIVRSAIWEKVADKSIGRRSRVENQGEELQGGRNREKRSRAAEVVTWGQQYIQDAKGRKGQAARAISVQGAMINTICLSWTDNFLYFHFYVLNGMSLKGMVESSLLSKDEALAPNIYKVVGVWISRRRA